MSIADLPYMENANHANRVQGGEQTEPKRWQSGNYGAAIANSIALGTNTFSESRAKVSIWQNVGSSSSSYAAGLSVAD